VSKLYGEGCLYVKARVKRLSFEMLYYKGKSKNEEFRKESTRKEVAEFTYFITAFNIQPEININKKLIC
jgi:hypothetical protein